MRLYIGNATKQHHDFVYWVPGARSARTQRVEIGRQVEISGSLDQAAIDSIIQQHAPYGLVAASEASHVRDFVGLIYSVDKTIASATIHQLMTHNAEVLVARGKEIRKEAAVAGNEQIEASLQDTGRPETLRAMEASVVEENHDDRSPDPAVAEGFRVIKGGAPEAPPRSRRRSRRAA